MDDWVLTILVDFVNFDQFFNHFSQFLLTRILPILINFQVVTYDGSQIVG